MPPTGPVKASESLQPIVDAVGLYPADAFLFVQSGLSRTVEQVHGPSTGDPAGDDADAKPPAKPSTKSTRQPPPADDASRHITGRDLCLGLRDEAWDRWGYLARTVLGRWNVTSTLDFGRIVFALVEHGQLQKTDDDTIEDFRGVYDFRAALEADYRIAAGADLPADPKPKRAGKKG